MTCETGEFERRACLRGGQPLNAHLAVSHVRLLSGHWFKLIAMNPDTFPVALHCQHNTQDRQRSLHRTTWSTRYCKQSWPAQKAAAVRWRPFCRRGMRPPFDPPDAAGNLNRLLLCRRPQHCIESQLRGCEKNLIVPVPGIHCTPDSGWYKS